MPMDCAFCSENEEKNCRIMEIMVAEVDEHLIVTLDKDGHFHVHGPIDNKDVMRRFIEFIAKEAGFELETEDR